MVEERHFPRGAGHGGDEPGLSARASSAGRGPGRPRRTGDTAARPAGTPRAPSRCPSAAPPGARGCRAPAGPRRRGIVLHDLAVVGLGRVGVLRCVALADEVERIGRPLAGRVCRSSSRKPTRAVLRLPRRSCASDASYICWAEAEAAAVSAGRAESPGATAPRALDLRAPCLQPGAQLGEALLALSGEFLELQQLLLHVVEVGVSGRP